MNDLSSPSILGASPSRRPGLVVAGWLAVGWRAMVAASTGGLLPCAIALGAILAFWGLPPR